MGPADASVVSLIVNNKKTVVEEEFHYNFRISDFKLIEQQGDIFQGDASYSCDVVQFINSYVIL